MSSSHEIIHEVRVVPFEVHNNSAMCSGFIKYTL